MRIGIYGGSFNPIHIGHLHAADTAARRIHLDRVLFVPSKNPYTKSAWKMETYHCRKTMVEYSIFNDERFFIADDGSKDNEPTYTYVTVKKIKEKYLNDQLFLIVGEDAYMDIENWKNVDELLNYLDGIFVIRRGNTHCSTKKMRKMYPIDVFFSDPNEAMDISSTKIRSMLKCGLSCKYLLPPYVYEYILTHKLYKDWEALERETNV